MQIEPVKWAKGMTAYTFPRLNWNIKVLAEVSAMDLGNCPVVGNNLLSEFQFHLNQFSVFGGYCRYHRISHKLFFR